MAKRGEKLPWKVTYRWVESGIGGRNAYHSEDQANMKAAEIRRNGEVRGLEVVVEVKHVP